MLFQSRNLLYFAHSIISFKSIIIVSVISAQCVRSKEHKDERITIRGGPDAGTILSNHFCMKYFYISNNTVGLGMSLFKTHTHPSSFYILLSASANCEKDYYTFFPQNFYIKKQIWFLFLKKYGCTIK